MPISLRAHLLLLVVALVIPLAGMLGLGAWRDAQEAENHARAAHRPLARLIATDVGRRISHSRTAIERMALRASVQSMDSAACAQLHADLQAINPVFLQVTLLSVQGQAVCTAPAAAFPSLPPEELAALQKSPESWIGKAPSTTPNQGAVLGAAVHSAQGDAQGWLLVYVGQDVLIPSLAQDKLPSNNRFGIFHTDGTLLWRNHDDHNAIGTRPDWQAASLLARNAGEFESLGMDGVARFYTTASIPDSPWVAYFGAPSAPAHASARAHAATGIAVGVAIVLLLCLVALTLARRIARPIHSIESAVQRYRAGEQQARAAPGGPTELAQLARDVNQLLDERTRAEAALQAQHQDLLQAKTKLNLAQEIASMGVWCWDLQNGTAHSDETLARMFGYEPQELHSIPIEEWRDRTQPDDLPLLNERLRACVKGETAQFDLHHRVRHRQGHWIWGHWRGRVTERDAQGKALTMMGSFIDVTERMQERTRLQLAASVFSHAREGITITDPQGTIIDVNDTFTRITGYTRAEAIGQNPRMLQSGRQGPAFYAAMWQSLHAHGHWSGEVWNRRKNGEIYAEVITISAVHDAQGKLLHYVALFSDITAQKEYERKLEHVAHYDALTGLPNRVLLADRLQQSMLRCQRKGLSLAVALLDLDGFKAINDRHGHDVGDQLLVVLAQRLKAALREGDTLSRIGGDEFVAVLIDLEHARDAEPVLARMLRAAADPAQVADHLLQVSASVGITLYPADGAEPDLLIRHADQAMYQAKQAGKNRYHLFDVAHDRAVATQREEVARIRQGLQAQEFVLHYQPKVDMRSGQVVGAEALIRWQHPERGLLSPASFLPATENHPQCIDLGEWVIASALQQMAQWQGQGLVLPVSVNIDAMQLQHEGFSQRLAELLAQHPQVPPQHLGLEILETNALEDVSLVSDIMRRCQALGVRFALDDFGTGYSSLTYLKRLGAEEIKIDQSFVRDMLIDPDDLAIVQGVIGLAQAFGREVVAEGVETLEHGTRLLDLGCHLAQGYGIARPMPGAHLLAWTRSWRADARWHTTALAQATANPYGSLQKPRDNP